MGRLKGLIFNLFVGVLNRHRYMEINHPSKTIRITFFIFCSDICRLCNFDKILSNADDHAKKILLIRMTVVHRNKLLGSNHPSWHTGLTHDLTNSLHLTNQKISHYNNTIQSCGVKPNMYLVVKNIYFSLQLHINCEKQRAKEEPGCGGSMPQMKLLCTRV